MEEEITKALNSLEKKAKAAKIHMEHAKTTAALVLKTVNADPNVR